MASAAFTIPAAELPLVEASLPQCPGVRLVGTDHFRLSNRPYCELHLDYTSASDLYQLGYCVGLVLEQHESGREGRS